MAATQNKNEDFFEQIQAFGKWREVLFASIKGFQSWLEDTGLDSSEQSLKIYELMQNLRKDRLTLAFVGEFSRGKTELINSIFFSHFKMRLLPSEAGRTTMCPTEIFFDDENPKPYLKLLPIETRLDSKSLNEHRRDMEAWAHFNLDAESGDSLAASFAQITETTKVSIEEADRLGLYEKDPEREEITEVEIPKWRQALINFPHPFLEQGLCILDTPGLNSLGNEPELTISMLPNAQGIVFVLSADTGVTRSDMDIWQQYLRSFRRKNNKSGLVIALNKIDTLWDDLKHFEKVQTIIDRQCEETASTLSVDKSNVLAVSAQKALLARVRDDNELLERSNLLAVEKIIADDIIPQKEALMKSTLLNELKDMMLNDKGIVLDKFKSIKKSVDELSQLGGRNDEVIQKLLQKTRDEQGRYHHNKDNLKNNRGTLATQHKRLLSIISLDKLDLLVTSTRDSMKGSWTTPGLKNAMKIFFDGIHETSAEANKQVELTNRLIQSVYKRFSEETGYSPLTAPLFDIKKHINEMEKLHEEAEAYRNSTLTTMTEQSFVIKNFFITLVSQARNIFYLLNREANEWESSALTPLVKQLKMHKKELDKRLEQLKQISESKETLDSQIKRTKKEALSYYNDIKQIDQLIMNISAPVRAKKVPEQAAK